MDERDHDKEEEGPLSSEALARDRWRGDGGGSLSAEDAPGHTLPASESDAADTDESGRRGPSPLAGTVLPPD